MKDNPEFDAVIIGAGIAGLSIADALMGKGYKCAIIDKNTPGSGASGAPKMLINPATGRRAKMSLDSDRALPEITSLLKRVQASTDEIIYEKNGVIRPALDAKIASDFENSPGKYDWPSGWISWLNKREFTKKYPCFKTNHGGLIISEGLTVNGKLFIDKLSKLLTKNGLKPYYNSGFSYSFSQDSWSILINNSVSLSARCLIFAGGYSLTKDENWKFLELHPIKGQTAEFTFNEPLPFHSSVSSLGYMAYMSHEPDKLVVGSTYEHHFDHFEPDSEGLDYLKGKLEKTLPGWSDKIIEVKQWSGIRVTTRDKKPVIGQHPQHKGVYIFGGLGSKGMLLGRYCAGILSDYIVNGEQIPTELSIQRFV